MCSLELISNSPSELGYPAVTKDTKAAFPFSLAVANASSILPPIPRLISEGQLMVAF